MASYNWDFLCQDGIWYSTEIGSSTVPPMAGFGPGQTQCAAVSATVTGPPLSVKRKAVAPNGPGQALTYVGGATEYVVVAYAYFTGLTGSYFPSVSPFGVFAPGTSPLAVPVTSVGSLLTRDSVTGLGPLPRGASTQWLSVNSTDLVWVSPIPNTISTGTVSSISTSGGVTGGPITSTGTIALTSIAPKSILANESPTTSAAPAAVTLAVGEILTNTSTNLRLSPGTNLTFVQSNGTVLTYAQTGMYELIETQTASSGTVANFSLPSSGSLPTGYTDLMIIFSLNASLGSSDALMQCATGGGSVDTGSNYNAFYLRNDSESVPASVNDTPRSSMILANRIPTDATAFSTGRTTIANYNNTTRRKFALTSSGRPTDTGLATEIASFINSGWTNSNGITSMLIFPSLGVFNQYSTSTGSVTLPPMTSPGPVAGTCLAAGSLGTVSKSIRLGIAPSAANQVFVYDGSEEYYGTLTTPMFQSGLSPYSVLVNSLGSIGQPTLVTFTASGDLLTRNSSTGVGVLPRGSTGQYLTSNGSDLVWATVSAPVGAAGTVTNVATSGSLAGGPITSVGTIVMTSIAPMSFLGVSGASAAEPVAVSVPTGHVVTNTGSEMTLAPGAAGRFLLSGSPLSWSSTGASAQLIERQTVTVANTTQKFTLPSAGYLPTTYQHLRVVIYAAGKTVSLLYFNLAFSNGAIFTTLYEETGMMALDFGGGATTTYLNLITNGVSLPNNNLTGTNLGFWDVTIPNYRTTTTDKMVLINGGTAYTGSLSNFVPIAIKSFGNPYQTGAVTNIQVGTNPDSLTYLNVGSTVALYGFN